MLSTDRNVVKMRRTSTGVEFHIDSSERVRRLLSEEIDWAIKRGSNFRQIALSANISPSTVSKLYWGQTKRPQFDTVLSLLVQFDFEVTVRRR